MQIMYCHHAMRKKLNNKLTQQDGLTSLGVKDAKNIAKYLREISKREKIVAIHTSQFYRCQKTAEILNKYIKVPIVIDKGFDEFKSVDGETWADCQNRIMTSINKIVKKYKDDEMVICVASGVNIAGFINSAYKLPASEDTPFMWVGMCSPIVFNLSKNNKKSSGKDKFTFTGKK